MRSEEKMTIYFHGNWRGLARPGHDYEQHPTFGNAAELFKGMVGVRIDRGGISALAGKLAQCR